MTNAWTSVCFISQVFRWQKEVLEELNLCFYRYQWVHAAIRPLDYFSWNKKTPTITISDSIMIWDDKHQLSSGVQCSVIKFKVLRLPLSCVLCCNWRWAIWQKVALFYRVVFKVLLFAEEEQKQQEKWGTVFLLFLSIRFIDRKLRQLICTQRHPWSLHKLFNVLLVDQKCKQMLQD